MNHDYILLAVAALTAVLGVGRLARLIVFDAFPPAQLAKLYWYRLTMQKDGSEGDWNKLLNCQWCIAPWLMVPCVLWGWLSGLHWSWWLVYGTLALAYLASMVVARDEPE